MCLNTTTFCQTRTSRPINLFAICRIYSKMKILTNLEGRSQQKLRFMELSYWAQATAH